MIRSQFLYRIIFLILILLFLTGNIAAQVDRTDGPKSKPQQQYKYSELIRRFDYDNKILLGFEELSVTEKDGSKIYDIVYSSPMGGSVSSFLVVPPGKGPFAGIIFLHWGQGDRNEFVDEALELSKTGAVSLLIDAPFRRQDQTFTTTEELFIQTIIDIRRAVDLLTSRPDIDPNRIGYVGHSFGATWGGVLAGVEKRIKAHVLMAGYIKISETDDPSVPHLDAVHYIGHSTPSALLFQFADKDEYISIEAAKRFYDAAGMPKDIKWYNTDHAFNEKARKDRIEWLSRQLGLKNDTNK